MHFDPSSIEDKAQAVRYLQKALDNMIKDTDEPS